MSEDVPNGWTVASLGDLGRWCSGGTPSRAQPGYYGPGVPWVKTGELRDGLIERTEESITAEGLRNSAAKVLPAGSLLLRLDAAYDHAIVQRTEFHRFFSSPETTAVHDRPPDARC